jgi:DNA gyrase subunit A
MQQTLLFPSGGDAPPPDAAAIKPPAPLSDPESAPAPAVASEAAPPVVEAPEPVVAAKPVVIEPAAEVVEPVLEAPSETPAAAAAEDDDPEVTTVLDEPVGIILGGLDDDEDDDEPLAVLEALGGGDEPPTSDDGDGDGDEPDDGTVSLLAAARTRYLNYALSVITARALPDVRDGLKPVQRRIMYAMFANLRLLPTGRYRKSAAVVGEVMARFHPHGDQSIYDAMVRLAQPFSLRAPLVDGHGNFGSLDGDPAAAMRYTESKLRALATELLTEIGQDTVAFRANYDGTTTEPVVLPARFPNLLVNGVTGIAVGMATNIPPHNLTEVCRAAVALIDAPEADVDSLMEHLEGPDFPVGGEILNSREELAAIYRTGRGPIKLRSTYRVETANRRRWIIIDSIPYAQNKATIVEQIGLAIINGKVPQLTDVRDESTDDIRIVLEMKRGHSDQVAMAWLYKNTNLRINFHVNLTVLLPTANEEVGRPAQVGLVEVLRQFNRHRFVVVTRRFEYELKKIQERLHILRGFAILFDALDEAIALIRNSEGKKDAAKRLMARFPLDAIQTEAILELKLYRLAKLQIHAVREELARLEAEAARIQAILASEDALWDVVRQELLEVAAEHGTPRRTRIGEQAQEFEFDPNAYIIARNTWVVVTRGGWIKRQHSFSDIAKVRVRDGDSVGWAFRCSTRSNVAIFSDAGKAYVLLADDIPQTTGYGEPVQRHFNFSDGEQVAGVISLDERNLTDYVPGDEDPDVGVDSLEPDADAESLQADDAAEAPAEAATDGAEDTPADEPTVAPSPVAVAITRAGKGLMFPLSNHADVSTRSGRKYATLARSWKGGDRVVAVYPLDGPELRVCLASEKGRALVFWAETLKLLQGTGKGVNAIRLGAGDGVLDYVLSAKRHKGLIAETSRGGEARVNERKYGLVRRGGKGIEVVKRAHLLGVPRDPVVQDPTTDDPDELEEGDLDALEELDE